MTRAGAALVLGIGVGVIAVGVLMFYAARPRPISYATAILEKDEDPPGGGQPALGGPGDPSEDAPAVGAGYKTPTMQMSADDMDQAQFTAYLRSLTYDRAVGNGQFANYDCQDDPTATPPAMCNGPKKTSEFIEPEVGMIARPHTDFDTMQFGAIVARIQVYGRSKGRLPNFNVPIGTQAWWLIRKVNGTVQSQIIIRKRNPVQKPVFEVRATLPFVACDTVKDHNNVPADSPTSARWWNCKTYTPPVTGLHMKVTSARSYFELAALAPFAPPPPTPQDAVAFEAAGWIRCGNGCCATAAQ